MLYRGPRGGSRGRRYALRYDGGSRDERAAGYRPGDAIAIHGALSQGPPELLSLMVGI